MITLIYGDDNLSIANFINGHIKKYISNDIYRLEGKEISTVAILELNNSDSLFSTQKLIIVKPKTAKDIRFKEKDLAVISSELSQNIIIDASLITQKAKLLKLFKKHAVFKEFKKRSDYTSFNIADALIIDGNAKKAISIFMTIDDVDSAIYGIIGAMQYSLRSLISLRFRNEISKTLKPFVKQKLSKSNLSNDDIKHLYNALMVLDASCKNYKQKRSVKNLFIDFVLNNFAKQELNI